MLFYVTITQVNMAWCFMGNTLWFINLLKDQPWFGFLIGLAFVAVMFGSKNLVIYFYSRSKERQRKSND
ncbi:MAG: hypothetical protein OQK80_00975 [Sedimenticola sp.]|nr:hypothetical protein [Sedimenticola sp.]